MTTIITLVVLVSLRIVLVDGECQTNGGSIEGKHTTVLDIESSCILTYSVSLECLQRMHAVNLIPF